MQGERALAQKETELRGGADVRKRPREGGRDLTSMWSFLLLAFLLHFVLTNFFFFPLRKSSLLPPATPAGRRTAVPSLFQNFHYLFFGLVWFPVNVVCLSSTREFSSSAMLLLCVPVSLGFFFPPLPHPLMVLLNSFSPPSMKNRLRPRERK